MICHYFAANSVEKRTNEKVHSTITIDGGVAKSLNSSVIFAHTEEDRKYII